MPCSLGVTLVGDISKITEAKELAVHPGPSHTHTHTHTHYRFRAKREQLTSFSGGVSARHSQNIVLTVLYVPCSLGATLVGDISKITEAKDLAVHAEPYTLCVLISGPYTLCVLISGPHTFGVMLGGPFTFGAMPNGP